MSANVPPDVAAAAAVLERWTSEQERKNGVLPAAEVDRMSPAERIDYCRRFRQDQMPAWKDPRT